MISQADVDLDKFGSFETQKVTNLKLQTNCNSSPTVNAFWKIQIIKHSSNYWQDLKLEEHTITLATEMSQTATYNFFVK